MHALNSAVVHQSSVISSRRASSPPTSDPIDVDMLGSDVEEPQTTFVKSVGTTKILPLLTILQATQSRQKWKIVIDNSDEEPTAFRRRKEKFVDSSPTAAISSKLRTITMLAKYD